jgi:ribosome-binding protein aMBF1 (putative translation factor)
MRICEVCGRKEGFEDNQEDLFQAVKLHVCDSCRKDRKIPPLGDWAY